jgi:hypothetical protein
VALGVITIALLLDSFAWLVLHRNPNLSGIPDKRMPVLLTEAWRWRWSQSRSQCRLQSGFSTQSDLASAACKVNIARAKELIAAPLPSIAPATEHDDADLVPDAAADH